MYDGEIGEPPFMFEPSGTRVIISTPQASTTSSMPAPIMPAASDVACCDEPHWLSTVVAATSIGRPCASQATRAMLNDCSPTCETQPPTTWPTARRIDAGALDRRALHRAEQIGGMEAGESALAAPDRGSAPLRR